MRKYNATEKGALYNRKHAHVWRKKNKTPHGKRATMSVSYRAIIVDAILKRDGPFCGICKQSLDITEKFHIDHIIPAALGGPEILENIQLAHIKCNLRDALKIRKQSAGY